MIFDKVVDLLKKVIEYSRVGGDKRTLGTIAASEVLWGNDRNSISRFRLHQKNFWVIICKIGSLNNLGDERPKFERLVRGLMVENKVYAAYFICLTNKE